VTVALILFQVLIAPGFAIARGGRPERHLAIAYWLDSVSTFAVMVGRANEVYLRPEWAVAAIDLLMLLYALSVTLRANRWWPIWFTAFHMIGLIAHVAKMVDTNIAPLGYRTVTAYVAYPLWILIIVGTIGHEIRLRRYGRDPDWKRYLQPSTLTKRESGHRRF
jgi:hypothetical protein